MIEERIRYGCEVWGWRRLDEPKIRSFEMWCYRRMLKIPWTDRVTNAEVLRRIKMLNTELLEKIKEIRLHFQGHAQRRSAGEELKTIINEAATQRNTCRERKRITWYDSSKEIKRDWREASEMEQDRNR